MQDFWAISNYKQNQSIKLNKRVEEFSGSERNIYRNQAIYYVRKKMFIFPKTYEATSDDCFFFKRVDRGALVILSVRFIFNYY